MPSFKLFTAPDAQPKGRKGKKKGYLTFILHLAPARLSGYNVCASATDGCILACTNYAGRGGIGAGTIAQIASGTKTNAVQEARIRRTKLFFENRAAFTDLLVSEIEKAIVWARTLKLKPVFRLNGTSDIRWEGVAVRRYIRGKLRPFSNVMLAFPRHGFYDYTKHSNRRGLPSNYSLTFSLAENNVAKACEAARNGLNVAVVFRDKATVARYIEEGFELGPSETRGALPNMFPVFNGDDSDLRFLDPPGHIIGLYAKGRGKRDVSGFVRD